MKAGRYFLVLVGLSCIAFGFSSCGQCHDCDIPNAVKARECHRNLSKAEFEAMKYNCEVSGGSWH